ncbi:MAG: SLBB domain-containing protein, partial [Gammaproteobacteria bacterium]|nr:SLBB domain-containing protein [Gammaproteobacteria bacterium]
LRLQSRSGDPTMEVAIGGRINAMGSYPLEDGMRISDLIRAGGGLQEAAYTLQAELTRYDISDGGSRQTELIDVNLEQVLAGDQGADLLLKSHDNLIIKEIPQWQVQESVELVGEVRFPGTYILQRGEQLSSVLQRAGGLTDLAFADGSVFVREDLKRREQEQIEHLASRLEADIVAFSLQALQTDTSSAQALSIGQSLLQQLRETRATGRLVIDINNLLADGDMGLDIVMRDGDRLLIPKKTQEVTVLGEVQYATSHIYRLGLSRDDYISRSGGLTEKADKKRIYVVRANGAVLSGERSRWFQRRTSTEINPGDTIVAPLDADRMNPLALWTNVSQIVYQLALAAASANAVGVF